MLSPWQCKQKCKSHTVDIFRSLERCRVLFSSWGRRKWKWEGGKHQARLRLPSLVVVCPDPCFRRSSQLTSTDCHRTTWDLGLSENRPPKKIDGWSSFSRNFPYFHHLKIICNGFEDYFLIFRHSHGYFLLLMRKHPRSLARSSSGTCPPIPLPGGKICKMIKLLLPVWLHSEMQLPQLPPIIGHHWTISASWLGDLRWQCQRK